MSWTDERIETLRRLWAEGLSASQIATTLGGVSRNAVIGKIHRLGLSGRVKPAKSRPARQQRAPVTGGGQRVTSSATASLQAPQGTQPRVMAVGATAVKVVEPHERPAEVAPPVRQAEVVPLHEGVSLLDLAASRCRWPLGDPAEDGFAFCGAKTAPGETYCQCHAEIAFPHRTKPRK